MTDVECVLLLWKAHGEESGGPMRSFVRWSVAICGQVPEKKSLPHLAALSAFGRL